MWVSGGGLEVPSDSCGGHSSHPGGWYIHDVHTVVHVQWTFRCLCYRNIIYYLCIERAQAYLEDL